MRYDELILGNLLDSYENSLLSSGKNKVQIHISMSFSKKNMPEYFDESSLIYEEIHGIVDNLEKLGFLKIQWKQKKPGTIIEKVILQKEKINDIYKYLHRTPKAVYEEQIKGILQRYLKKCQGAESVGEEKRGAEKSRTEKRKTEENRRTEEKNIAEEHNGTVEIRMVEERFLQYLLQRLEEGKSVKEFIDISNPEKTTELLDVLSAIENNQKEVYIREFSIENFGDAKKFENMLGLIEKIMCRFKAEYEGKNIYEILGEHQIYRTPNYVYFKGTGSLELREENGTYNAEVSRMGIDLSLLQQGIAISDKDICRFVLGNTFQIKKVITIENLTTFYRWNEPKSLMIYLGGFHNHIHVSLLQMIYKQIPQAEYLHFGDIDVGGFEIYRNLCQKTGIPFQMYYMGIPELKKYQIYGRKLTENDNRRLDKLLEKISEDSEKDRCADVVSVLKYMKITQLKLEQECIECAESLF